MNAISNLAHTQLNSLGKHIWTMEHSSSINESPFNIYPLVYLFVACTECSVCTHYTLFNVHILCARVCVCVYIVDIYSFSLRKQKYTTFLFIIIKKKRIQTNDKNIKYYYYERNELIFPVFRYKYE